MTQIGRCYAIGIGPTSAVQHHAGIVSQGHEADEWTIGQQGRKCQYRSFVHAVGSNRVGPEAVGPLSGDWYAGADIRVRGVLRKRESRRLYRGGRAPYAGALHTEPRHHHGTLFVTLIEADQVGYEQHSDSTRPKIGLHLSPVRLDISSGTD